MLNKIIFYFTYHIINKMLGRLIVLITIFTLFVTLVSLYYVNKDKLYGSVNEGDGDQECEDDGEDDGDEDEDDTDNLPGKITKSQIIFDSQSKITFQKNGPKISIKNTYGVDFYAFKFITYQGATNLSSDAIYQIFTTANGISETGSALLFKDTTPKITFFVKNAAQTQIFNINVAAFTGTGTISGNYKIYDLFLNEIGEKDLIIPKDDTVEISFTTNYKIDTTLNPPSNQYLEFSNFSIIAYYYSDL